MSGKLQNHAILCQNMVAIANAFLANIVPYEWNSWSRTYPFHMQICSEIQNQLIWGRDRSNSSDLRRFSGYIMIHWYIFIFPGSRLKKQSYLCLEYTTSRTIVAIFETLWVTKTAISSNTFLLKQTFLRCNKNTRVRKFSKDCFPHKSFIFEDIPLNYHSKSERKF